MEEPIPTYVLDSFAILAYLQGEIGGDFVQKLLQNAEKQEAILFVSIINLGEVYYIAYRSLGENVAKSMVTDVRQLPLTVQEATEARVWGAANLKAQYPLSYADAFAASLANELNAFVVTGDPEFQNLESFVDIVDISKM